MILALDLSPTSTGVCFAPAGRMPQPFLKAFRNEGDPTEIAAKNAARWLRNVVESTDGNLLVAVEQHINQGALKHMGKKMGFTPGRDRDAQLALHYAILGVCACYDRVRFESVVVGTVRKHFCGQASAGSRAETKKMVLRRAIDLGYLGRDVKNDNLADAAALFHYAVSKFAQAEPGFALR